MASKGATVSAHVDPEDKRQAEEILDQLGVPVSILIKVLYRQIILTHGIPFSLSLPKVPATGGRAISRGDGGAAAVSQGK